MIDSFVSLISSFLTSDFLDYWFYPVFFGLFVASVPAFIRSLFMWR